MSKVGRGKGLNEQGTPMEESAQDVFLQLINETKGLELGMSSIQADLPSTVSDEDVWELRQRYLDWYQRAGDLLTGELKAQFEGWFTGEQSRRPMKSFVTDPKKTYVPEGQSYQIYAHPYHLHFLEPITEQTLILLAARRRAKEPKPLSGTAAGSSSASGNLTFRRIHASEQLVASMEEKTSLRRMSEGPESLEADPGEMVEAEVVPPKNVFIGHGRSLLYLKVQEYLKERLHLDVEFFEAGSRTALHNISVLETMLTGSAVAVIVMTGEDLTAEGKKRARQNVVHEIGLFQGKLGFDRVAILMQEEIELFSNIEGLQRIQFADDRIDEALPRLERFLERVGLLQAR